MSLFTVPHITTIQVGYALSLAPDYLQFQRAHDNLQFIQTQCLNNMIERNMSTNYGKTHKFHRIKDVASFQEQLPVIDYDDLQPWIDKISAGECHVLTREPVLMMERSSGSSSQNKLIPYTSGLLKQYASAVNAWLFDLYRQYPSLLTSKKYWSISPSFHDESETEGGVPIGFDDDTGYFGATRRWAINQCLAVPGNVNRIREISDWQYQTALSLLKCKSLGMISVWSPTFILSLLNYMTANVVTLSKALSKEARYRLDKSSDALVINAEVLWPRLKLLSCWNDGVSSQFVKELRSHFPRIAIQGKGLLATEGIVSVPMSNYESRIDQFGSQHGSLAAVTSHFLEFLPVGKSYGDIKLVHELEKGERYSPIITTAGGLYRYLLKDVVICTGHYHSTPMLEFESKLDVVTDLVGEKLNANLVTRYVKETAAILDFNYEFLMLSPRKGNPSEYMLFIESEKSDSELVKYANTLEQKLCHSHHYEHARKLGQLQPLKMQRVRNGWSTYQDIMLNKGVSLGDIKPSYLNDKHEWHEVFVGR